MKSLILKTIGFRFTGSRLVIGILFASALSILSISSAIADRDDFRGGWGGRGDDYREGWHGDHDGWRRGGYGYGYGGYGAYQGGYPQPYGYAQPVYVPPPVYYPPQPSPGISLFFPLNFRR